MNLLKILYINIAYKIFVVSAAEMDGLAARNGERIY